MIGNIILSCHLFINFVFAFFFGLPFHELYSAAKQSFQMLKRKGDQTAPKSRRAACSKGVSGRLCVSALDREKGEGKREKGERREATFSAGMPSRGERAPLQIEPGVTKAPNARIKFAILGGVLGYQL